MSRNVSGLGFGLLAVALWSSLAAVAGQALDEFRPLTLLAVSLPVAGTTLLVADLARGRPIGARLRASPGALFLGLAGIGVYHACLYGAFALAPRVPANLVNYLWPIFLVLLGALAERRGLRRRALVGAAVGFSGAALAMLAGSDAAFAPEHLLGYALAFSAAILWAVFSVGLTRVPGADGRMALFCLASGGAAAGVAVATGWGGPLSAGAWVAALYLGAGPLGLAFGAWEAALTRASAQSLGALSYLSPPVSTLLLAASQGEPLRAEALIGLALVVGGAALGASGRSPSPDDSRGQGPT